MIDHGDIGSILNLINDDAKIIIDIIYGVIIIAFMCNFLVNY